MWWYDVARSSGREKRGSVSICERAGSCACVRACEGP